MIGCPSRFSVDQSRSFASYMHNDDNELQYFSLDFGGEPIAFHGGDILTKATFLNKALDAIVRLYENAGRSTSTCCAVTDLCCLENVSSIS